MVRTTQKEKGHLSDRVVYHVKFASEMLLNPVKSEDNDPSYVKIPTRLSATEGDTRANTTNVKVRVVDHYEGNVEWVLESWMEIQENLLAPMGYTRTSENVKKWLLYMQRTVDGTARQQLTNACRLARNYIAGTHLIHNIPNFQGNQMSMALLTDSGLFSFMDRDWDIPGPLDLQFVDTEAYQDFLYEEYQRAVLNGLFPTIFGESYHKAHADQVNYLQRDLIKPYGMDVEKAFRRIDHLISMLEYFPPPSFRGQPATMREWELFKITKIPREDVQRDMKYRLLPSGYQVKLSSLEADYEKMTDMKFLSETQKFEQFEKNEREKTEKKRKDSAGSKTSSEKRIPKKKRTERPAQNPGLREDRFCRSCKNAGMPPHVCSSHNQKDCKRKDRDARRSNSKPSSSAGSREFKVMARELKLLKKQLKESRSNKKRKRADSESSEESGDESE